MYYAIELYFDEQSDLAIRQVWERLKLAALSDSMISSGSRPHVSVAVSDGVNLDLLRSGLTSFATLRFPKIEMDRLGVFAGQESSVIYAAVKPRDELLALHRLFYDRFEGALIRAREYYYPGRWVPHCTIGFDISNSRMKETMQTLDNFMPVSATIVEVGVVRGLPVQDLLLLPVVPES